MKQILIVEDDPDLREVLGELLTESGFSVTTVKDGLEALWEVQRQRFDLVLLDIWLPRLNGLELLAEMHARQLLPKVIVMTGDNTPETLLRAVREQAYRYVTKPIQPSALIEMVQAAVAAPSAMAPIEVLSARPDWVELLVPCEREAAERIQEFLEQLEADLPDEVRAAAAEAFRELLLNAVEWGGKLDPNRKVRISYLRARRMLLYRISDPGPGFRFEGLTHAAIANPPDDPLQHAHVREAQGMRPGGFGLLLAQAKVDELLFNEQQNEVVLVKYLDEPANGEAPPLQADTVVVQARKPTKPR